MPCKMKIKNLYLEDFFIYRDGTIACIKFNIDTFYIFRSGSEAEKIKEILIKELAIPENEIKIFMIE